MSLEKLLFNIKKGVKIGAAIFSLGAILSCANPSPESESEPEPFYDYTTTVKIVRSDKVDSLGGIIKVEDPYSLIKDTELTIPHGALNSDTLISIGEVNNPPTLPRGLNYVGAPVDLEPEGINFNNSLTIQIHYNEQSLSDAGISDDSDLNLYSYDKSSNMWTEANIISVDRDKDIITASINHFSYYAITCMNAIPPEDLGTPQLGDLVYSIGAFWNEGDSNLYDNWMPGHVGIYTGEKQYSGTGLASDDVKHFQKYNVIEALPAGVQYSYYNLPNVKEIFEDSLKSFGGQNMYMGAREPKDWTLTSQQRQDIVNFVEEQVGKPYAWLQTVSAFFGMLRGSLVKGPFFNCVGLAEKAYELAGVNNGEGLVSLEQEEMGTLNLPPALTPAEQYNQTKPAQGKKSKIPFVSFTGRDTDNYQTQISIMNEDGSGFENITSDSFEKNYPRLSPDRSKIIFGISKKNENGYDVPSLCTMNLDGSNLNELEGLVASQPAWSSKDKIAFINNSGFITIHLTDLYNISNQEKLTSTYVSEKMPYFCPDGNSLIYVYNGRDIVQIDLSIREQTTLIPGNFEEDIRNLEPEVSPDGNKIAFASYDYDREYYTETSYKNVLQNSDIYLYDINLNNIQRLTNTSCIESSPHFSKDGSKIFFVSDLDETSQIYSMNNDGSNQKQLTYGPENHSF